MQPHQFKAAKAFLESIKNELALLKEAIQKHTSATTYANKANEQKWREVPRIIASNVLGTENDKAAANTKYEETYRQQERLVGAQNRTVFWARLAFFAAAGYGSVAFWQGCLMHRTYVEIERQTRTAQDASYSACINAKTAQQTLLQIEKGAADSHLIASATVKEAAASVESEKAAPIFSVGEPAVPDIPNQPPKMIVPFTVQNEGKVAASNISIIAFTLIIPRGHSLNIWYPKSPYRLVIPILKGGQEFPGSSPDPKYKPTTASMNVMDENHVPVTAVSQAMDDFYNRANVDFFTYGKTTYTDFSGTRTFTFCREQGLVLSGSDHGPTTKAEKTCMRYEKDYEVYGIREPPQPPIPNPPEEIVCKKPPE